MTASPSDSPQSSTDSTTESVPDESIQAQASDQTTGTDGAPEPPAEDTEDELTAPAGETPAAEPAVVEAATAEVGADEPADATIEAPTEQAEATADGVTEGDAKADSDAKADESKKDKKKDKKKKPSGPEPSEVIKRIGTTSSAALAYVQNPDQKLSRMARKHREAIITEVPPVTAGALLGPEALCRHFLASAATGRYQDLFSLWDLFKAFPEECKPVLASRQKAQERARAKLRTATHLGLLGDADRVAADIDRAVGLPWRWLKEILEPMGPAIRQRPAVLAALARRGSEGLDIPEDPSDRWLAEAAALKESGVDIPEEIDAMLGAHADRLPATVATLQMAQAQYPDQVPALVDRIDLDAPDIGAMMAWARDHGHADQLLHRIEERVRTASAGDRATGLAEWTRWKGLGVDVAMPDSLTAPTLEGLDLGRPESAALIKHMVDSGADLDPQQILDEIAADNRMRGEKAYESFVCAGFDSIHLPLVLEGNPMVRPETRCQACQAWTWVRPGHEGRCPRRGEPAASGDFATDEDTAAAIDQAVAGLTAEDPQSSPSTSGAPESRPATTPAERAERPAAPPPAPSRPEDTPAAGSEPDAGGAAATASEDVADDEPGTTGS